MARRRYVYERCLHFISPMNPPLQSQYFLLLSEELRNEQRPDRVRQLAGTQMKVSLDAQVSSPNLALLFRLGTAHATAP